MKCFLKEMKVISVFSASHRNFLQTEPQVGTTDQLSRRASTILSRLARTAGMTPPIYPIMMENRSDLQAISKVRVNEKASSEKVCQFMVEMVINCRNEAHSRPVTPPVKPSRNDSIRKADKILER